MRFPGKAEIIIYSNTHFRMWQRHGVYVVGLSNKANINVNWLDFLYDLISCSIKKTKKICLGGQTDIANFFQAGYIVVLK